MTAYLEMRAVGRHGQYDVLHNGEVLCRSSEPLLAGCRKLLERGYNPHRIVEIRHEGEPGYSMRSRIGTAARLTVKEDGRGPRFVPWKGSRTGPASPPIEKNDDRAPDVPADAEIEPCSLQHPQKSEVP